MQFIPCLNKEITVNYHKWLGIAKNICRKKDLADELLHCVIGHSYANRNVVNICAAGEIEAYIVKAMYISFNDPASRFWKEQHIHNRADLTERPEPEVADQSTRMLNETVDSLISRLPPIESELMRLYALDGFSYEELSQATGVPIDYLYSRIKHAKHKLRRYVNSSQA